MRLHTGNFSRIDKISDTALISETIPSGKFIKIFRVTLFGLRIFETKTIFWGFTPNSEK